MVENLSLQLARHVAETPADALPATTLHAARRALLDGYGVMMAASGMSEDVRPFIDLARESGGGPAPVLGTGILAVSALAALANGAMAHALDYEDAFDLAPCHPNASLLPAALAVAATHPGRNGTELLAAIAIGCDLVCRLGLSLRRTMEAGGWYPPPILGAFGAVAAAARLRGLDARQTLDAFSLILGQISMPGEIKHSRDTVIRAVREGFPAQAAVVAVELAAKGVRGFDAPFEGRDGFFRLFVEGEYDPAVLLGDLGRRWWIEALSFKRWPSCRGTHPFIAMAIDLRAEGIDPAEIRALELVGSKVMQMLVEPSGRKQTPATVIDAKFSIPFTLAATFTHGGITLDSFGPGALADPAVRALAGKVGFTAHPDWGHDRAASGRMRVVLADGRILEHTCDNAPGDVAAPLDDVALTEKFVDCAGRAARPLSAEEARRRAAAILALGEGPLPAFD